MIIYVHSLVCMLYCESAMTVNWHLSVYDLYFDVDLMILIHNTLLYISHILIKNHYISQTHNTLSSLLLMKSRSLRYTRCVKRLIAIQLIAEEVAHCATLTV